MTDWRRDGPAVEVTRRVWGREMRFLVEETLDDHVHACTVDDVAHMLNLLPKRHINSQAGIDGIRGVVLRQLTRREERHASTWGRMTYFAKVANEFGPIIQVTAQPIPLTLRWGKRLRPEEQRELELLRAIASRYEATRRGHEMEFDLEAVRRVQLSVTVPHEVGHWADMFENVEMKALGAPPDLSVEAWEARWTALRERYFARPQNEREVYANRYADEARMRLEREGALPFARLLDLEELEREGLRAQDFVMPDAER